MQMCRQAPEAALLVTSSPAAGLAGLCLLHDSQLQCACILAACKLRCRAHRAGSLQKRSRRPRVLRLEGHSLATEPAQLQVIDLVH